MVKEKRRKKIVPNEKSINSWLHSQMIWINIRFCNNPSNSTFWSAQSHLVLIFKNTFAQSHFRFLSGVAITVTIIHPSSSTATWCSIIKKIVAIVSSPNKNLNPFQKKGTSIDCNPGSCLIWCVDSERQSNRDESGALSITRDCAVSIIPDSYTLTDLKQVKGLLMNLKKLRERSEISIKFGSLPFSKSWKDWIRFKRFWWHGAKHFLKIMIHFFRTVETRVRSRFF